MRTVYKYELKGDGQTLEMPADAQALSVGFQGDSLVLWALVDTNEPMEARSFWVTGTGHVLPAKDLIFIGTAERERRVGDFGVSYLIMHVFEVDDVG